MSREFLSLPKIPVLSALPAAGQAGRVCVLSSNKHFYHDNGVSWDDLNAGIASINADTTSAQVIAANDDISVATASGTTTVRRSVLSGTNSVVELPAPFAGINGANQAVGTVNYVLAFRFRLKERITVAKIGFKMQVTAANYCRIGIYDSAKTSLLIDSGAQSTSSSSSQYITLGSAVTLSPSVDYWLAVTIDHATVAFLAGQINSNAAALLYSGTAHIGQAANNSTGSGTGLTLPSSLGTITGGLYNCPMILLQG